MQQIRETALACYDGFSEDRKDKAYAIFETMDSDGDGTVSLYEYEEFFGSSDRNSFQQLDANGDGKLDFEEFITLFYIILTSKGSIMSPPVIKAQPKPSQSNQVSRSRSSRTLNLVSPPRFHPHRRLLQQNAQHHRPVQEHLGRSDLVKVELNLLENEVGDANAARSAAFLQICSRFLEICRQIRKESEKE
ncbi:hypothetical protein C1H46_014215 [Malus baccata]|uniref:EF-hand domain-containing protein n=1 Tax=Malus baccata TaxID=106549 RepID=A0A540MPQ1_MALBA|nr:hypothetical protein C1H46_014215 [Malus baccata]